jgi:hypothetical protein
VLGQCGDDRVQGVEEVDPVRGEIEFETPEGPKRYLLKPLPELFGKGTGAPSPTVEDERFMPLLLGIEEAIAKHYLEDPDLTDGRVSLALSRLVLHPGHEPKDDLLCAHMQTRLRLVLSLNDYSRQEVLWALRTVEKSVRRHSRVDGPQGYLEFILRQLGPLFR